ncbi:hypothetical protein LSH36_455g06103 [Paralvinella palmiformis]|uniref:Methyltransferase type 11 domain-containing protein n=1 Tax=Paralvinella palmiformis TaxID=53620 RepID=A0AAD9MXD9_9ANNE|nr:hypothetical protein LSH36_455g06103 [Paralvinella palmiformis]
MDLENGQQVFNELLKNVDSKNSAAFLKWVIQTSEQALKKLTDTTSRSPILDQIRSDLRDTLPLEAVLNTETIIYPNTGDNADCTKTTTIHVDAFLYDDEAIDDLVDAGRLSRNYCKQCGSHQVAALTFISHSMSCTQLQYIFNYMLPNLQNKLLVDVGSRVGPVLYGAYLYSDASRIVGVEMNAEFCHLQQKVIEKYKMEHRVQPPNFLSLPADVVVMNNVFEFFANVEMQKSIQMAAFCRMFKASPYTVIVKASTVGRKLYLLTELLNGWLMPVNRPEMLIAAEYALFDDHNDSDISEIYMYSIL